MLRYFRINDPYRLAGLLFIMLLIYVPQFVLQEQITYPELRSILVGEKIHQGFDIYTDIVDNTAPLAAWFYGLIDILFGRSLFARHILTLIIIFFQSAYLGIIFIDKKAFSENTYIPSLLFSIFFAFSFDTLMLSGELIGFGFLLLALNNLFKEIEFRVQRDETVFTMGLFIGLASLCSFSYVIFLPGTLVILLVFTRTVGRKFFLFIFGFSLAHVVFVSLYYFNGSLQNVWTYFYQPGLTLHAERFISMGSLLVLSAVPLGYLLISLVILNREARFTKYQSQLLQAMFLWMIFSFIMILLADGLRPQTLIVLIPVLTFFMTHLLLLIRRRRFAEMNIWVLLGGVIAIAYMSRFNAIESVSYDRLIVKATSGYPAIKGKKVLLLGDDAAVFKNNVQATGFIDWHLTKAIFENPALYDGVLQVYRAFSKESPDVIIDPNNLMAPFFDRIPELKARYVSASPGVYQLKK